MMFSKDMLDIMDTPYRQSYRQRAEKKWAYDVA